MTANKKPASPGLIRTPIFAAEMAAMAPITAFATSPSNMMVMGAANTSKIRNNNGKNMITIVAHLTALSKHAQV